MAKNREPIKPVESESSEEEEQSDSGNDDSSSEEEDEQVQVTLTQNKKPPPPVSDDDSGSETESESEEDEPQPKKPTSAPPPKPAAKKAEPVTPAKRPSEAKDKQSKKKKPDPEAAPPVPKETPKKPPTRGSDSGTAATDINSVGTGTDASKKLFQRLWSDEDEVAILQGMLDYEAEKKASPRADCDAFLEFIKSNLHVVDVNKTQLQHKIRRLKQKYDNNRSKDRTHLLKKPHEQALYDLSDKIWGRESSAPANAVVAAKANGAAVGKKVVAVANDGEGSVSVDVERRKGSGCRCGLTMEDRVLCRGDELFGEGNGNEEGAKEWKRLQKEDMELTLKKVDVRRAQIKLVLDNWD